MHTNLNQQDTVPIRLQTNPVTRLRADLPTEPTLRWHRTATHTPSTKRLCRYACNLSDAGTVLPHTINKLIAPLCLLLRIIAPIRLRSTDQMIVPVYLQSNDYACMPTIYEPDNRCTDMPATQIDKTPYRYACGINPITTMPLRLQPEQMIVPVRLRSTN